MSERPELFAPTLHTAALAALEQALNAALRLDSAAAIKLAALRDHVFKLECTSPRLDIFLIPGAGNLRLCGVYEGRADTTLKGSFADLLQLASAADPASALINGGMELHGNSQALIELQTLAHSLELDWEAPLARLFGDVAGHQLGRTLRSGFAFARQGVQALRRQVRDYVREESELAPAAWQLEQFYRDVGQLDLRSQRLAARIDKLARQLAQKKPPQA